MSRRVRQVVFLGLSVAMGWPSVQFAQTPVDGMSGVDLIAAASRAAAKFKDLNRAIRLGYRLVGPDFPGMGEHWVNPSLVVRGIFVADMPPILSYVRLEGKPVLTGVAYAVPVNAGVQPPSFPEPGLWHFHSGTLDDEALLLNPRSMKHSDDSTRTRLAMLHVWTELENPAGIFNQDNWSLPFFRLGLEVPDHISPQCGKALHLMSDGVAYYLELIKIAGEPTMKEIVAFTEVLESRRSDVERVVRREDGSYRWPEGGDVRLSQIWARLWDEIHEVASDEVWAKIAGLSG